MNLVEGDVVGEKYRLERLVGEGAMGRVYRAHHLLLGHSVAIKFLNTEFQGDDTRARFVREARATMSLRSEHVVRVFDLGVTDAGTPFIVLEFLEGTDLRSLLATRGSVSITDAVDYVLQACDGLAEAHANGIIHRDLKPQNLFLAHRASGAPCVKVLDFGVSKLVSPTGAAEELTMSNVLVGSPVYVSPEQIRSAKNVDVRTDVWSLGVVLYMLLGGGRPFEGEGVAGTCAAIVADPPRALCERCPDVPAALEEIIFRCLEKSRERRVQSVAELASLLAPFGSAVGRVSADHAVQVLGITRPIRPVNPSPRTEARPTPDTGASVVTALAPDRTATQSGDSSRRKWIVSIVAVSVAALVTVGLVRTAPWAAQGSAAPIERPAAPEVITPPSAPPPAEIAAAPPRVSEPASVDSAPASRPSDLATTSRASAHPTPARTSRPPRAASPKPAAPPTEQLDRNGVPIIKN